MDLAQATRELRRRLRMTQQTFASRVGLAMRTVSVYESGKSSGTSPIIGSLSQLAAEHGFRDLVAAFDDLQEEAWVAGTQQLNDMRRKQCQAARELLFLIQEIVRGAEHGDWTNPLWRAGFLARLEVYLKELEQKHLLQLETNFCNTVEQYREAIAGPGNKTKTDPKEKS